MTEERKKPGPKPGQSRDRSVKPGPKPGQRWTRSAGKTGGKGKGHYKYGEPRVKMSIAVPESMAEQIRGLGVSFQDWALEALKTKLAAEL